MSERSRIDRLLAAIPFAIAALALLSLYFWQASARKTPTIFSDELEWTQLSRAIAATGHAARRGQPIGFKSLYSFLIAPAWWIHSTPAAYATAKYIGTVVMCLAAIPTYLLARTLVTPRAAALAAAASICTSALFYGGYLLPETLAYPTFALCAYAAIRALAGGGRRWVVAAIVLALVAQKVRSQLAISLAALALAAVILWLAGPRGARLRARWTRADYGGALVLLIGAVVVANQFVSSHSVQWNTVMTAYKDRFWTLGLTSFSALAIGLGLLPLMGGLASLWVPERRTDPAWRAFAAYLGSAVVVFFTYTAVKAAYLSATVFTRIEERNLIYLGPLLIVGTAVHFTARRPWLPGSVAAVAVTAWLALHYGYQLDYPYFESPGYGIATLANRAWHWNQDDIRIALAFACAVAALAVLLPRATRLPRRPLRAALGVVLLATVTWMLAGEITSANGAAAGSRQYYGNLPKPVDWVDRAAGGEGVTFIGQHMSQGEDLGVNMYEFWNRSIKNIWSLDGTAPPPGPVTTPDLVNDTGTLSSDPGLPLVLETDAVDLTGDVVDSRPGLRLLRVPHPWGLRQTTYGISNDGWISGVNGDATSADAAYAYFDASAGKGTLTVDVNRTVFCHKSPGTNVVVRIGPVALNDQRAAVVTHPWRVARFHLADCAAHPIVMQVRPPLAVQIHVSPLALGTDYGLSDNRLFGARAGFAFTQTR